MTRLTTVVGIAALALGVVTSASAAPILELEPNNTIAGAQVILASSFTTPVPGTVFPQPGFPTATVTGSVGGTDVDFYAFMTTGGSVYFDIDDNPFTIDTVLSLFDASGTLIAYGDDTAGILEAGDPGALDAGTVNRFDSFIGLFALPASGTYYLAVSQFGRFPTSLLPSTTSSLTRPDGFVSAVNNFAVLNAASGDSSFTGSGGDAGIYTLHISVQNPTDPTVVPEPATMLLFGTGLTVAAWRRRRH